jgi:hypothetical protein
LSCISDEGPQDGAFPPTAPCVSPRSASSMAPASTSLMTVDLLRTLYPPAIPAVPRSRHRH